MDASHPTRAEEDEITDSLLLMYTPGNQLQDYA